MSNRAIPLIRPSRPDDDPSIDHIIRTVMTGFGAVGEGYSCECPQVDALVGAYDPWMVLDLGAMNAAVEVSRVSENARP